MLCNIVVSNQENLFSQFRLKMENQMLIREKKKHLKNKNNYMTQTDLNIIFHIYQIRLSSPSRKKRKQ